MQLLIHTESFTLVNPIQGVVYLENLQITQLQYLSRSGFTSDDNCCFARIPVPHSRRTCMPLSYWFTTHIARVSAHVRKSLLMNHDSTKQTTTSVTVTSRNILNCTAFHGHDITYGEISRLLVSACNSSSLWIKWPTFHRQYYQMHFHNKKTFWFLFHWSLLLRVQLAISLHWFDSLVALVQWTKFCWQRLGPRLNIKTVLSTYGDFHVKDKTAVRTSYL